VVPASELVQAIWGDHFVSGSALTTRIKEVRRAVGDDGTRQEVIKNVRGTGYRFIKPLADGSPSVARAAPLVREPLVGRQADVVDVARLIERSPLVTLTGPGGVGKTSLALATADRIRDCFSDGVIVVDLTPITDPRALMPALQQAASLADPAAESEAVLAALSGRDALIVLDNCEHLIDAAAATADRFLQLAGRVRLLATSREPLHVPGEQLRPVDVLDLNAARELLERRALAIRPDFSPSDAGFETVDELLKALDRLPLAIEMAAARLSAMAIADLLALINDQQDVLRLPDRTAGPRHRTLGAVVAWSERLLEDHERRAFTELAVFAGPVPAADVVGVLRAGGGRSRAEVMNTVAELVDRSLLVTDTSARPTTYRMLETVKAHAALQRNPELSKRHVHWFCDVAAEADVWLRTPQERKGHDRIEAARAEFRAAHRWAREHAPELAARLSGSLQLHAYTRLWAEPAAWAGRLVPVQSAAEPTASALWAALAADAAHRNDLQRARALAERALSDDRPASTMAALDILIDVDVYLGDLEAAHRHIAELGRLGARHGDRHAATLAVVDGSLAWTYGGDPERALDVLVPPAPLDELAPSDQAWLAYAEGEALGATDAEAAVTALERAGRLAGTVGNRFLSGVAAISLTSVRARTGDPEAAQRAFSSILAACRRNGNLTHAVTVLRNLVELLVRLGDDELAMIVLGAVSNHGARSPYGDEAVRLDEARRTVEARSGLTTVERWLAKGGSRGAPWALAHAIERLPSAPAGTA
jgi:predicted ATPase